MCVVRKDWPSTVVRRPTWDHRPPKSSWEPFGSQSAPRTPATPRRTDAHPPLDLGKRQPRWQDQQPNLIRDEEVVGSNPATPTAETADQAGTEFSTCLICFCLRVCLSDYRFPRAYGRRSRVPTAAVPACLRPPFPRAYGRRSCVPKMPSMTTAPVWITGRICFGTPPRSRPSPSARRAERCPPAARPGRTAARRSCAAAPSASTHRH